MSIPQLKPTSPIPTNNTTTLPEVLNKDNKSIFHDLFPESKVKELLKYVEGYNWSVVYYGQILNEANTLEQFDPETVNLTQAYYKINNASLKVSSPLTSNYDQQSATTRVTGSSLAPIKTKPNVGDVFIARVDSGQDAVFSITSVSRKTYRKDTLYEIEYSLIFYISDNPTFMNNLESRVQQEFYYDSTVDITSKNSLVTPTQKEAIDRLKKFLRESTTYYFTYFCAEQEGTLLTPNEDYKLYDPLLVDFIYETVDHDILNNYSIRRYSKSNNRFLTQPCIWTAILNQSMSLLNIVPNVYGYIPTYQLKNMHRFGTAFYADIDYILYPLVQSTSPYSKNASMDLITSPEDVVYDPRKLYNYNPIVDKIKTVNQGQVYEKKLMHELFNENYYIVSEYFYEYTLDNSNYSSISFIELQLYKYMNKEIVNREDVCIAIENYMSWPALTQYYMLPLMWLLAKYSLSV